MNYRVDYEKQLFRMTKGRCQLYGKPVRSMVAIDQNTKKHSNLLVQCGTFIIVNFPCHKIRLILKLRVLEKPRIP